MQTNKQTKKTLELFQLMLIGCLYNQYFLGLQWSLFLVKLQDFIILTARSTADEEFHGFVDT